MHLGTDFSECSTLQVMEGERLGLDPGEAADSERAERHERERKEAHESRERRCEEVGERYDQGRSLSWPRSNGSSPHPGLFVFGSRYLEDSR